VIITGGSTSRKGGVNVIRYPWKWEGGWRTEKGGGGRFRLGMKAHPHHPVGM